MLDGAMCIKKCMLQQDDTPSRCAKRGVPASSSVRQSSLLSQKCGPQQPRFKSGGLCHLGDKSATAGSSTPLISRSRRSCWSGIHYHIASWITASVNGDVVRSVSWFRISDTLNTLSPYCKIIVVAYVLEYFLEYMITCCKLLACTFTAAQLQKNQLEKGCNR